MGSQTPFTADVGSRNGVAKIALSGELDMATVPVLSQHLRSSEEFGTTAIILDLRNVTFMDSAGLAACVKARARAEENGHRFMVVEPVPSPKRIFEMTGTRFLVEDAASVLAPSTDGDGAVDGWSSAVRDGGPNG